MAGSPGEIKFPTEGKKMKEQLLVYMACYADGYQEILFLPVDVADSAGVEAFEADLRRNVAWFHPIGEIKSQPDGHGGVRLPMERVGTLVQAWEERGSPKIPGAGAGPSPLDSKGDTST